MRVGPCIPVGVQLEKAGVGPISGPTWRLSHLGALALLRVAGAVLPARGGRADAVLDAGLLGEERRQLGGVDAGGLPGVERGVERESRGGGVGVGLLGEVALPLVRLGLGVGADIKIVCARLVYLL